MEYAASSRHFGNLRFPRALALQGSGGVALEVLESAPGEVMHQSEQRSNWYFFYTTLPSMNFQSTCAVGGAVTVLVVLAVATARGCSHRICPPLDTLIGRK